MKPICIIDKKKQAELETDPDVSVLTHSKTGDQIAVRPPSKSQFKRFRAAAQTDSPEKKDIAEETLVIECLVFPSREDFSALLERRPGLIIAFANAIADLAGAGGEAEKKG